MAQAKRDSITRRGVLSALTLLPTAAVLAAPDTSAAPSLPAASSLPDPIFAAIEAHARACAELEGFAETLAEAEQTAWHAPRGKRRAANKRLKETYDAQGRLCDSLSEATECFAATVPTTLAGAAAALAYVREHYAQGYPVCEEEEFITLIGSTEQAIRRWAQAVARLERSESRDQAIRSDLPGFRFAQPGLRRYVTGRVGWAKARSAVPTRYIDSAPPAFRVGFALLSPPYALRRACATASAVV